MLNFGKRIWFCLWNRAIKRLLSKKNILSSEFKYFSYSYKKSTNLDKIYLLLKTCKQFENVPGCSVISNCGTPTEKVSEFFDYHLKSTVQSAKSYFCYSRCRRFVSQCSTCRLPRNISAKLKEKRIRVYR